MKKITRTATTLAVGLGLAGFLALGATLPAHAAGSQTSSVIIASGSNGTGAVSLGDFSTYTLGDNAMPTASWGIDSFTDARGTAPGWNITLSMSQFTGTTLTNKLPVGSIAVTTPASVLLGDPTGISFPATVLDNGAVKLVSAANGDGAGTFTFNAMTVTLTVPITALIDTYTSDATVATVATP